MPKNVASSGCRSRQAVLAAGAVAALLTHAAYAAQRASPLEDVLSRLVDYLDAYEPQLSHLVALETYEQHETRDPKAFGGLLGAAVTITRHLESDFSFLRLPDGAWEGLRDTFRVDGKPLPDHESRLFQLLADGGPDAIEEARRIVRQNTQFNVGHFPRTINAPMVALDLLTRRHRDHFVFQKQGDDAIDGQRVWRLGYRELGRPSLIQTSIYKFSAI